MVEGTIAVALYLRSESVEVNHISVYPLDILHA